MNNNWTNPLLIGLIAVLVLGAGAASVFAQDEPVPDAPRVPRLPFGPGGFHGGIRGHGGCGGANNEAFADALGVTPEELQDAREKVEEQRLAEAVEAGILTQEQVDNMLAMRALKRILDHETILAQALGLDPAEIEEAREAGTLRELLADAVANTTPADLQANMKKAVEDAVAQAVNDGEIDDEQAAIILEHLENGAAARMPFSHRGFGGRGKFHGAPRAPWGQSDGQTFAPFRGVQNFGA